MPGNEDPSLMDYLLRRTQNMFGMEPIPLDEPRLGTYVIESKKDSLGLNGLEGIKRAEPTVLEYLIRGTDPIFIPPQNSPNPLLDAIQKR